VINPNEEKVLTNLGLTSSEARVFLALARMGPSKVTSISQSSGIHRTHLYEVLKSLESRGFVEKQLDSGIYLAIPLNEAAQFLVRDRQQEISKLESEIKEISESLPRNNREEHKKPEILLTSNKNYTFNRGQKYLESAKTQIDQMHTWKRFTQLWQRFETTFADAFARDVKIRQIVEFPPDMSQAKKFLSKEIFANPLFEVRFVPTTGGNLTIIDNERLYLSTSKDKENLGETPLLFSDYEGLLGLMQTFYAYSWRFGYKWVKGNIYPYDPKEDGVSSSPK
jgi:sugar-specific transcriptional regulator TrmB